jgi:hypothetical protein
MYKSFMKVLVKNKKVKIKYVPDNGAWTFHVVVPNTKDLEGGWGYIKVTGTIDGYDIKIKNLMPQKGKDMLLAVNAEIRKAIKKKGEDSVNLTLYLVGSI